VDYTWVVDGFVWLAKLAGIVHLYVTLTNMPKGRAIMPKATINVGETHRYDLKTLPAEGGDEGGFVELRVMSYGEFLRRRDLLSKLSFEGSGSKEQKATMEQANEIVAQYEFQSCIVDHNLEDDNGKQLDFRNNKAFRSLDPRIGEEIASYIDELNKWNGEDEEDLADLKPTSTE
jgi:hypothetical protein